MLDVGCLAPENATCALCDRHDYLHRTDLPNYLTSPCYHCRESFAREAKISPEDLFDLHLQVRYLAFFSPSHNVPWPAFLQARFNIPPDGRSMEDLIAYDCRWRCREPCTCLPDISLPPCVEFPWLYAKIPITAVADTTAPASCSSAEKVPPSSNPDFEQAPSPSSQQQSFGGDSNTDQSSFTFNNPPPSLPTATSMTANIASIEIKSGQHQQTLDTPSGHQTTTSSLSQHSKMSVQSMETTSSASKHQHLHSTLLPCASRHARGALGPPQCCDPIGWPFASSGDSPLPQHNHNSLPPEREKSPAQSHLQSAVVEPQNL
ncbi:unnamed protein product [Rodentolepis nana]|uniref:C2H2-type domain-containing protein n=1 Tax=Rodentolepis nana TaxID=102285 RepID=A0A0R3T8H3_RODNA|nr:unnamed protein product [Rodentolepis nana]